jgi:anti-sigma-K factor RskA
MDLHRHPGLLDRLAAEYALGTLRGGARRRLESLALCDGVVQKALNVWRIRIEAIAELAPGQRPPDSVWGAIETRLGLGASIRPQPAALQPALQPVLQTVRGKDGVGERAGRWFESLNFWRGWAIAASAVAVLALGIALWPLLQSENAAPARISYVAVLHDQTSQQSTLLITWDDAHGTMTLRKLANYPLQSKQVLQLWGLPPLGKPVSLGVIRPAARYSVQLYERPQNYPVLAVSVEPAGGSPNPNGPSGLVVFTGKLVPTS